MDEKERQRWIDELEEERQKQPETSWTIARFKMAYAAIPGINDDKTTASLDVVSAAGACNAHATAIETRDNGLIEVRARFNDFDLRGRSHIIGDFQVLLQDGKEAAGRFSQKFKHSKYPLQGGWDVPFVFKCRLGNLIPRPTDDPVFLSVASPGEFAIPPIGTWFEKWDPIDLVDEKDVDGPTIAICEQAMHLMVAKGKPDIRPEFFHDGL